MPGCFLILSGRLLSRPKHSSYPIVWNEEKNKNVFDKNFKRNMAHKSVYLRKHGKSFKLKHTCLSLFSKFLNFDPIYYFSSRPIFLFRSDLNYEENNLLKFAFSLPVIPVFIYCSNSEETKRSNSKRNYFLDSKLKNLQKKLLSINLELFIFDKGEQEIIPIIVNKFNSKQILYSFNTFCPLNLKKERKLIKLLRKMGVKPMIFMFEPFTMTRVNFYFRNKILKLTSSNCKDLSKSSLVDIDLSNTTGKLQFKSNLSTKSELIFSLNRFLPNEIKTNLEKKNYWNNFDGKPIIDYPVLKNIYSEFNLGSRLLVQKLICKFISWASLLKIIEFKTLLKFFLFLQNMVKKNFLVNNLFSFI